MSTYDPNTQIAIEISKYDMLVGDSLLLQCLQNCGVNNWDGWDTAMEMFQEMIELTDE